MNTSAQEQSMTEYHKIKDEERKHFVENNRTDNEGEYDMKTFGHAMYSY